MSGAAAWLAVLSLAASTFTGTVAEPPKDSGCVTVNLLHGHMHCTEGASEMRAHLQTAQAQLYAYEYEALCVQFGGGLCDRGRECRNMQGEEGELYAVRRRLLSTPEAEFVQFAIICLVEGEEVEFDIVSWRRVLQAMRTMVWPQAELHIQPPGGTTLVNLETNFFTTTTPESSITQTVHLPGHQIFVTARPVEYTWHWGDGTDPLVTDNPGEKIVDEVTLEVAHAYLDADIVARPSLDVTYRGEYTIDGGPPRPIPETLTVPGDPQRLRIVEAIPHLLGND